MYKEALDVCRYRSPHLRRPAVAFLELCICSDRAKASGDSFAECPIEGREEHIVDAIREHVGGSWGGQDSEVEIRM